MKGTHIIYRCASPRFCGRARQICASPRLPVVRYFPRGEVQFVGMIRKCHPVRAGSRPGRLSRTLTPSGRSLPWHGRPSTPSHHQTPVWSPTHMRRLLLHISAACKLDRAGGVAVGGPRNRELCNCACWPGFGVGVRGWRGCDCCAGCVCGVLERVKRVLRWGGFGYIEGLIGVCCPVQFWGGHLELALCGTNPVAISGALGFCLCSAVFRVFWMCGSRGALDFLRLFWYERGMSRLELRRRAPECPRYIVGARFSFGTLRTSDGIGRRLSSLTECDCFDQLMGIANGGS